MGLPGRLDSVDSLPAAELGLTDAALVGRYAIQIAFASGHSTGIFTFRYLRGICPCPECRRA